MNRTLRLVTLYGSGTVILSCAILVLNQTAQVVQLTTAIHPTLGTVTLWSLMTTYGVLIGVPFVLVLRLPSPLVPPANESSPEFETHLKRLGERLSASPHLVGHNLTDRQGIEAALRVLDDKATLMVRDTASGIFLATAVSQSGRLDGMLVLAAQTRLVWKVAHIYYQRPAVRDLVHLYANVVGTSFIAGELQDIDLSDQVEPVLSSAIGALGASLPGLQVAGTILTNCVLNGSANAFLTLRVGIIARRHCGALVVEPRSSMRRSATSEAAQYLGAIVSTGSARVSKAVWRASVGKMGDAVSGVKVYAKEKGEKILTRLRSNPGREQPEVL